MIENGRARPAGLVGGAAEPGRLPGRGRARLGTGIVFAVPAVAELAVGGYQVGRPSLWRDEGYTVEVAHRSVAQILALVGHLDAVHSLYYLFMHFVVSLLGSSEATVRLPSLVGMSGAAGMIAVLGRRLAANSAVLAPPVTGVAAGLLFVAIPQTTHYAQDARPYGLTTLFAVSASYLLVRAAGAGRWRWWACYAAAIAVTAWSSLFALLLLAAHGVTLLAARAPAGSRDRPGARAELPDSPGAIARAPGPGFRPPGLGRWLLAAAAAMLLAAPLVVLGYRQSEIMGWVSRPGQAAVMRLLWGLAGSRQVLPLVAAVALAGLMSGASAYRHAEPTLAAVALPWLVLPPLILLAASQVHPVYVARYVNFCVPAVTLLAAAGLGWLARQVARIPLCAGNPALTWLPSAALAVVLAGLLIGPQQLIRQTSARPDNLRAVAATVSAHERPGDAVFYIPSGVRQVSFSYPAPFQRLRDVALAGPVASSVTLTGVQVSPATVQRRFAGVARVWVVTWAGEVRPQLAIGRRELAMVSGWRVVRRWHVRPVVLTLYAR